MNNYQNIHFFGFSVTRYGDPTYVDAFKLKTSLFSHVTSSSMGGVSFEALPYLMPDILRGEPECLVLEIGTSAFTKGAHSPQYIEEILFRVIHEACQKSVKAVIFLMLPRIDLPSPCPILELLEKNQFELGYGILNLQDSFRGSWGEYAVDVVHPTKRGIDYISDKLAEYITIDLLNTLQLKTCISQGTRSGLINISDTLSHHNYPLLISYKNSGFSYSFPRLTVGNSLVIASNFSYSLRGIFFIMGPDTGSMILSNQNIKKNVKTFDHHSYYYRIGFQPLTLEISEGENVVLTSLEDRHSVVLDRPSHYKYSDICNYPIALAFRV